MRTIQIPDDFDIEAFVRKLFTEFRVVEPKYAIERFIEDHEVRLEAAE